LQQKHKIVGAVTDRVKVVISQGHIF